MQFIGMSRRRASSSERPFNPRLNSLRVNRSCRTSGCVMAHRLLSSSRYLDTVQCSTLLVSIEHPDATYYTLAPVRSQQSMDAYQDRRADLAIDLINTHYY